VAWVKKNADGTYAKNYKSSELQPLLGGSE